MQITKITCEPQKGFQNQMFDDGKLSTTKGRRAFAGFLAATVLGSSLLTGCAGYNPSKSVYGSGIGAGIGAIVGQATGRSTEGTLIGTAVGGLLGYIIGNEIDKYDNQYNQNKISQVLESGESGVTVPWVNPDTGAQHTVTPAPATINQQTASPNSAGVCREFSFKSESGEIVHGVGCRDNSGNWKLVKAVPQIEKYDSISQEKDEIGFAVFDASFNQLTQTAKKSKTV